MITPEFGKPDGRTADPLALRGFPLGFLGDFTVAGAKAPIIGPRSGLTQEAEEKVVREMEMRPSAAKAVPIFSRLCTG